MILHKRRNNEDCQMWDTIPLNAMLLQLLFIVHVAVLFVPRFLLYSVFSYIQQLSGASAVIFLVVHNGAAVFTIDKVRGARRIRSFFEYQFTVV